MEFVTNWSMPPEEIVEFWAPCIYELRPVTGVFRTGEDWAARWGGKPIIKALMNLRQHTVYLGVVPFFFAVVGRCAALSLGEGGIHRKNPARWKRRRSSGPSLSETTSSSGNRVGNLCVARIGTIRSCISILLHVARRLYSSRARQVQPPDRSKPR